MGGFFEAGTLVRYNFLSEAAAANQDARFLAQPLTAQEMNLTEEAVAFSFSTSNTPAILLYVSSKTQDYLALVLRQNGETLTHTDTYQHTQTRGLCLSGMMQMQYVRSLVVCVCVCVCAYMCVCVCRNSPGAV